MPTLDLPESYLQILKPLLQTYAPDAEVWAYGSRVSGRAHETSDLDFVLRNPADLSVPQKKLVDLRAAISESGLPILVDVMDWARISQGFREEIKREHVVLQRQVFKDVKRKV
jgi:predicted nucleotidyltransferase